MHLRHEILQLGILPVTDRLKALNITHLNKYVANGVLPSCRRVSVYHISVFCLVCRHLEIFQLVQVEDERELAARLETVSQSLSLMYNHYHIVFLQIQVDSRNLKSMIDLLHRKTIHTVAHSNLLSIVYHCLLLPSAPVTPSHTVHYLIFSLSSPVHDPLYSKYWHLMDRLVQQVVLQQRKGIDPDSAPVSINVDELVQR